MRVAAACLSDALGMMKLVAAVAVAVMLAACSGPDLNELVACESDWSEPPIMVMQCQYGCRMKSAAAGSGDCNYATVGTEICNAGDEVDQDGTPGCCVLTSVRDGTETEWIEVFDPCR